MSRTRHHRGQKSQHNGHDYGGRYNCNKGYGNSYGVAGRDRARVERRNDDDRINPDELECEDKLQAQHNEDENWYWFDVYYDDN